MKLLFYCQHSLGMGHLVRSFALARALARHFDVLFMNGGRRVAEMTVPQGVRVIDLPPLGMRQSDAQLVSLDARYSVAEAQALRAAQITRAFASHAPAAIVIELFPFGRKKFAGEILSLLDSAHALGWRRPRIFSSVRDILVGARRDQQAHDDRASRIANRYFDAVLVHADAALARLDVTFRPTVPLQIPVHYTGFVVEQYEPMARPRARCVVVNAGGGIVGMPLYRAAVAAQPLLHARFGLAMRIVAGPFLPEADWRELTALAANVPGLEVLRALPSLRDEFARAAVAVGQCGYNSALDMIAARVPALVVPYTAGREDEQHRRALQLAALGALRVLDPERLDGPTLAREIEDTLAFQPAPIAIGLEGAVRSATIIADMVDAHYRQRSAA